MTSLIALLLSLLASIPVDTATDGPVLDCTPYTLAAHEAGVAAGTTHPALWDDLMAVGWRGVQGDQQEALYAPECLTIVD